jgi:hypothetical protein
MNGLDLFDFCFNINNGAVRIGLGGIAITLSV